MLLMITVVNSTSAAAVAATSILIGIEYYGH